MGRIGFGAAFALQQKLVDERKQGAIPDQLLFLEHPHVVTMGRNGRDENLLASEDLMSRAGIEFHRTNRGGDVTYHGPGQIVGYPILDLREWKRDVVEYVRSLENVIIAALAEFGIAGGRVEGCTGVWVEDRKIAAIGVHISRWVTDSVDAGFIGLLVTIHVDESTVGLDARVFQPDSFGIGFASDELFLY